MKLIFTVLITTCIVYLTNAKTLRGMLDANPTAADPLKQLTMAADKIETRFEKASTNPTFGKDLNGDLVNNVKTDSEQVSFSLYSHHYIYIYIYPILTKK